MNKKELEKMLIDPQEVKKFSKVIKTCLKDEEKYERLTSFIKVHDSINRVKLTKEEILRNDNDYIESPNLLNNMGLILPELKQENKKNTLKILTDRCRKDPSIANQLLVENAINQLTIRNEIDTEAEQLIERAIELLSTPFSSEDVKTSEVDNIWSRLFRRDDQAGGSYFINHGPGFVYRRTRRRALIGAWLNEAISSLNVNASEDEVSGDVILFQHDRFQGRYARFSTTLNDPVIRHNINNLRSHIDNKTSSILVVRHFRNELELPIGDLFDGLGYTIRIENTVNDMPGIVMRGHPIITWDMWPEGSPRSQRDPHPNDSSRRFVYVKIPVTLSHRDFAFSYDAEMRYWIYLWIDDSGNLSGYVAHSGVWVEPSFLRRRVRREVEDHLPESESIVNDTLNEIFAFLNLYLGPFDRQYFLPGSVDSEVSEQYGHCEDDITLVLVRR
ncbi:MAG: hypothetical protein DWQ04_25930 [Chloroflexi bacterium]|nr:MAG: hypothetical protein DWQ04_25930 [Chloroflexota bacterium]